MTPVVSICCMAYRQEDTIAKTLESFINQKTDYPFEILVHDDASSDRTSDIIREFALRYPDIIKPLYETENQYSKGLPMNETFNFPRARGKYIALCEGDDYWRDEYKLQKQVEFLESHPDCTFCFTNGIITDVSGASPDRTFIPYLPEDAPYVSDTDRDYSLGDMTRLSFVPTASFVFPVSVMRSVPKGMLTKKCMQGDLRMRLMFTAMGYARYIADKTCVYRANFPGSAMSLWGSETGDKMYVRCMDIVDMLNDVDDLSDKEYTGDLERLRLKYRQHALVADPSARLLRDPAMRRAYDALTPVQRAKVRVKAALPVGLRRALGK